MSNKEMSVSASSLNSDFNSDMCKNCLLYGCVDTDPAIYYECSRGIEDHFIDAERASLSPFLKRILSDYEQFFDDLRNFVIESDIS